ncbi:Dimodular nonribosomal peptide synthase [Streptomyces antimycoticus]
MDAEHPVYGLQSRGLGGEADALPATLEEMAADYVAQIRRVQPTGPYALLGWSLGGTVIHAMAALLQAEGEEVALLVNLDEFPLDRSQPLPDRLPDEQDALRVLLDFEGYDVDALGDVRLTHGQVVTMLRDRQSVLASLDEDNVAALARAFANNRRLFMAYEPAPYRATCWCWWPRRTRRRPRPTWPRAPSGGGPMSTDGSSTGGSAVPTRT